MQLKFGLMTLALLVTAIGGAQNVVTDSLEFDKAMGSTPAAMLEGRISGVRVAATDGSINSAVNTYIRGTNALRSDSQPLWIVDGVIINSSLNLNNEAFFQYGDNSWSTPVNALAGLNLYDIESIEVLKDVSATAIYGTKGANGVIIVTTKKSAGKGFNIGWRSNAGISTSSIDGTATGISHNHYVSLSSSEETYDYNVSANLKQNSGVVAGEDNLYGGMHASFNARPNQVIDFGMSANLAIGKADTPAGVAHYGQPSLTLLMRDPSVFSYDTVQGWQDDYDDEADESRATASAHLALNLTPSLVWKNTIAVDYQSIDRYVWYGTGTSFGKDYNGAASAMQTFMLKYNVQSLLSWGKSFDEKHNVQLSGAFDASGDWTKYNTTNGTDFFSHVLRARGIDLKAGSADHHVFENEHGTFGGFAKAGYDYGKVVGVDGTLRADITPKFYDDVRLNWSVNGYVDLRKALFSDAEGLSSLRLNAGYGTAGRELYVPSSYYGSSVSGEYPELKENYTTFYEGLNSLKSKELNAGLRLGALSDRFTLYVGYYSKSTDDQFDSFYFGEDERTTEFTRLASFTNKGIEFEAAADLVRTALVDWTVFVNGATNSFAVTKSDPEDTFGYGSSLSGNPVPKFSGAVGTTLKAGGFCFDVLADCAAGFDILNLNAALSRGNGISADNLEKGDWCRLSRVSAGYDFGMSKVSWIKGINVSLSALNLCTLSKYSGWNPDVNCYGTSLFAAGIDYGSYPAPLSAVLGVRLTF